MQVVINVQPPPAVTKVELQPVKAVLPQKSQKPPGDRARVRRLSDSGSLMLVRPIRIAPEPTSDRPVVWLADKQKKAYLPIAIGPYEAGAMASTLPKALSKFPDKPKGEPAYNYGQAYDLFKAVLDAFDIVHERAVIDLLHQDTFFAFIFFRRGKTVKRLDARPSDTIALSVRTNAKIYLHEEVLERAGVNQARYQEKQKSEENQERKVQHPYFLTLGNRVRFTIEALTLTKLRWQSSDPIIASVTPDGIVEGIGPGIAVIMAGSGSSRPFDTWLVAGSHPQDYEMGEDPTMKRRGRVCYHLSSKVSEPRGFGTFMKMVKSDDYRNKRVRLATYVKSEKVDPWAGLWMRVDGPTNEVLSFDNMKNRPIRATSGWKKYEVVLDVPQNSVKIAFGILLGGKGRVWINDLQLEIVEKDVPKTG